MDSWLDGEIDRIARGVIRRELAGPNAAAGLIDDLLADVRMRLLSKVPHGQTPAEAGIDDLPSYTAVVARNVCYSFLRAQFPERTRLSNRVRYAAGHQPNTTILRDAAGALACASRLRARAAPAPGATRQFIDDPQSWLDRFEIDIRRPLPALVSAILATLDAPIELDRLVDALALVLGIADPPIAAVSHERPVEVVDPATPVLVSIEQRESLRDLWSEILALPPRQRMALLLNLRDPDGTTAILPLLPDTGVASQDQIADALGLTPSDLRDLWNRLPLDDLAIAARMGVTRQQVINLRKSARARLARRLGGNTGVG